MTSSQREHNYRDLREAVIDVMLAAGDLGLDSFDRLLDKTAAEIDDRDAHAGARQNASFGSTRQLHHNDSELVLEIVWDLVRQGILTFGAPNLGLPWLRLSRFGDFALRKAPHRFHSNTGFLQALQSDAADISPDAVVYLREAVTAFYTDCLLSTCVMLSIAAESEFLRLLNVAKNSKAYGRYFSRIGEGLHIAEQVAQFKEAIKPLLAMLPKSATDELEHNLNTIQSVMRTARNESGHPSGALPPSRDQVYLYLQLFIPFAEQAMRLREELKESAYPRLVQMH